MNPITETIRLPYCWVSKTATVLVEHHVIPQSCGGQNGPTVTISADIHNILHKVANALEANLRKEGRLLAAQEMDVYIIETLPEKMPRQTSTENMCYLIRVAAKSQYLHSLNTSAKWAGLSIKIDPERNKKLKVLKKITGLSSKEEVVKKAIDSLYSGYVL